MLLDQRHESFCNSFFGFSSRFLFDLPSNERYFLDKVNFKKGLKLYKWGSFLISFLFEHNNANWVERGAIHETRVSAFVPNHYPFLAKEIMIHFLVYNSLFWPETLLHRMGIVNLIRRVRLGNLRKVVLFLVFHSFVNGLLFSETGRRVLCERRSDLNIDVFKFRDVVMVEVHTVRFLMESLLAIHQVIEGF